MIKYKKNTTKFFSIQSVQGATREGQEPISEVENRCSSAADMWRDVLSPKGWTCGGHHVGAKKK